MNDELNKIDYFKGSACVNIVDFIMPNTFDFAFAAMNTLRYIGDEKEVKRHFSSMKRSLKKEGIYLANIMLSPSPNEDYLHTWEFNHFNKKYSIEWKKYSYCHISNKIIDKVSIMNYPSYNQTFIEYQEQMHFSFNIFKKIINDSWYILNIFDSNFNKCKQSDNLSGNYWIVLKQKY